MKHYFIPVLLSLFLFSCEEKSTEEPKLPSTVKVTAVKIITAPLTDPQGDDWDLDGGADVYYQLENATNALYKSPVIMEDLSGNDLPLLHAPANPYTLPAMDQAYYVGLYDEDVTSSDDYMGTVSFNPEQFKADKPASKIFQGANVQVQVSFSWR